MRPLDLPWHLLPHPLTFVHLEITGFSRTRDHVVEVGMLRLEPGQVPRWLDAQLDPSGRSFMPTFAQLLPELRAMLDGSVLVAHHASLTSDMLDLELSRLGGVWGGPHLCTFELSKALRKEADLHSLRALTRLTPMGRTDNHAFSKAQGTAAVLDLLVHRAPSDEEAAETVRSFVRIPPHMTRWPPVVGAVLRPRPEPMVARA